MSQELWAQWAQKLQQNPLKGFILVFLEGSGPLKVILAQVMLAGTPFVGASAALRWQAIAEMLEDDAASREFAARLHEEKSH